jgi:hypothetical protein
MMMSCTCNRPLAHFEYVILGVHTYMCTLNLALVPLAAVACTCSVIKPGVTCHNVTQPSNSILRMVLYILYALYV